MQNRPSESAYTVPVRHQLNVAVKEVKCLGILQLIIGILSLFLNYWLYYMTKEYLEYAVHSCGMWTGVWIIFGGIMSLGNAKDPSSRCLNGTHLAFNLVSFCASFINFIVFVSAFFLYCGMKQCQTDAARCITGIAFYTTLLLCMLAEFIVSLTAAIYCFRAGCTKCNEPSSKMVQHGAPKDAIVQTSAAPAYSSAYLLPYRRTSAADILQQGQFTSSADYAQAQPLEDTYFTYAEAMPLPNYPGSNQAEVKQNGLPPAYN